jgi:hypothetical protein
MQKNSMRGPVLKGRGFQPRRKSRKINNGFSRCGLPVRSGRASPRPDSREPALSLPKGGCLYMSITHSCSYETNPLHA